LNSSAADVAGLSRQYCIRGFLRMLVQSIQKQTDLFGNVIQVIDPNCHHRFERKDELYQGRPIFREICKRCKYVIFVRQRSWN